jgi:hypothetical protein
MLTLVFGGKRTYVCSTRELGTIKKRPKQRMKNIKQANNYDLKI